MTDNGGGFIGIAFGEFADAVHGLGMNLALDLRLFGLPQAVDSQWCAQVKHYTVSTIRARIPQVGHGDGDGDRGR